MIEPSAQSPEGQDAPAVEPLDAIAEPFARPVPGANAAGENARYDPRHEAIRNEVEKLSRPSGEEVDWQLVYEQGLSLLTETSKDFLIAGYFTIAAYLRKGPRGLIEGISAMATLLDRFWDDGFPPPNRIRARINAIDWVVDRLESHGGAAPSTVQAGDLQLLSRASEKLESAVMARFTDEMPNIHGLKAALKPIELRIAEETPADVAAPTASPPAVDSAGQQAPPVAEPLPEANAATSQPVAAAIDGVAASGDPVAARFAELALPFATPIAGAKRAGDNARYDERYESIRREVDKLGKPAATELDWQLVEAHGRALLTETSKDYLIASYFGVASYLQGGVRGLVVGLAAIVALLRDFWDDGFPPPKRIRGRINAIDWFIERVETVRERAPEQVDEADLQLLGFAAKELEAAVLDRFDEEMPNIYGLKQTLQTIELSMAKHAPPPEPPPSKPSDAATPSTTASSAPKQQATTVSVGLASSAAALADPAEVEGFLTDLGRSIYKAGRVLFKASKQDPLAYRLCRQGLYMPFVEAPPATDGSRTVLPSPPHDQQSLLEGLLSEQDWAELLDEAESGLSSARHWLDQHRYAALALAGLGYDEARDAVVKETAAVVLRFPGMLDRQCDDGFPFASDATREWLDAAAPIGSGAQSVETVDTAESDGLAGGLAAARKLAAGGKLDEALVSMNAIIQSHANFGRDRFQAKLAMAEACRSAGSPALAEGILAGLSQEIAKFRLEEWEPKLAEKCYRARYEALTAMAIDSAKSRDELADVYRQLSRVAPATALKLGKPPQ